MLRQKKSTSANDNTAHLPARSYFEPFSNQDKLKHEQSIPVAAMENLII